MRLITLGGVALLDASGEAHSMLGHKRELALLSVLALSAAPMSRDALVEMIWPDDRDRQSRLHSLRSALSFLRGVLGRDAIGTQRAEIELAPRALEVDAVELLAAAEARDFALVIDLYRGPFLDGVSVSGSGAFDAWVAEQRAAIAGAVIRAAEVRCMATAASREWHACAAAARRWLDVDVSSPEAALHLLNSVRATGTPAARVAALAEYDRLLERLSSAGNALPDARVTELANRLQARNAADRLETERETHTAEASHNVATGATRNTLTAEPVVSSIDTGQGTDTPDAHVPQPSDDRRKARRFQGGNRAMMALAATAVIAVLATALGYRSLRTEPPTRARPLIVVTDIVNVQGDTASAWLEDGLPQMITAALSRSSDVETIAPVRVRSTRERARQSPHGALSAEQSVSLGRELGASVIVRGEFTHGNNLYVLDVSARNAGNGRAVGSFAVSGPDPMTVAGWAAGRIMNLVTSSGKGPRFADVETTNIAAYQHFVRALQATSEGRFSDSKRELDASITLDSGFTSALSARADMAASESDHATLDRIHRAMARARLTPWDLLREAIDSARATGENNRTVRLANELVQQYPYDPRAYATLASIYNSQGDWARAESTAWRGLALDSLANEAGDGPCAPCTAYAALSEIQAMRGDLTDAEQTARRWLKLQPDLPMAWSNLADVLGDAGHYEAALDASRRAAMLAGDEPLYEIRIARALLAERRLAAADSVVSALKHSELSTRRGIVDVQVLALRERGELRASNRVLADFVAKDRTDDAFLLEEMDALGRMGEYAAAARFFDERIGNETTTPGAAAARDLRGDAARWFCWTRAMEANAIAGAGDTLRLHAIADSIRSVSARSDYARDWRLHHHVLGLIAMRGKRYADAEREFEQARWGVAGWTETVAWLARAQLAQHHARAAVATLRQAYEGPLDGMGRYEPHSELDLLMARAFEQAGMVDSASVYAGYARKALGHTTLSVIE